MLVFLQPGRQRQDPDGRHPVCQHREIGLPGHEIKSGGMDKGDAHGVVVWTSCCDVARNCLRQGVRRGKTTGGKGVSFSSRSVFETRIFYVSVLAAAKTLVRL
jgi:hypothetical protein